jgi:peptide/nickel transport system substrate-binding protein
MPGLFSLRRSAALVLSVTLAAAGLAACEQPAGCSGDYCGALVFIAGGEPDILFPPVSEQTTARDISDQIFLKLADLGMTTNTVGDEGFEPLLAQRWQWEDSLTLVFHLDPRARWHDGRPVSAADVAFTFDAYSDVKVNSPARVPLGQLRSVIARDSLTAVFRFRHRYPEMFYDAVYHMRIVPAHLLHAVPRDRWATTAFGRRPVGNGPYRFAEWRAGEHITLEADSTFYLGRPHIRRLVWRVTPNHQAAMAQILAGEADALELLLTPDNVQRAEAAPHLETYRYPGSIYTYLAFNVRARDDLAQPHPLFGDRLLRRALAMGTDRERLLASVFGALARVPPGPTPQTWWLAGLDLGAPAFDSTRAAALLNARGWRVGAGGIRERAGVPLRFTLMVPTTSAVRRQYSRLLQAQYRALGVDVQIEEVEPSVFGERASGGNFDAALASWVADPTPTTGIRQTWTTAGMGRSNYCRYSNPEFDRLVERATTASPSNSRRLWEAAFRVLNHDVPAVWLYAPENVAAVHRRVADVRIRPDSWWALVRTWRIPADQLSDRDRAGH